MIADCDGGGGGVKGVLKKKILYFILTHYDYDSVLGLSYMYKSEFIMYVEIDSIEIY